jgi:hypothetical protein
MKKEMHPSACCSYSASQKFVKLYLIILVSETETEQTYELIGSE